MDRKGKKYLEFRHQNQMDIVQYTTIKFGGWVFVVDVTRGVEAYYETI